MPDLRSALRRHVRVNHDERVGLAWIRSEVDHRRNGHVWRNSKNRTEFSDPSAFSIRGGLCTRLVEEISELDLLGIVILH